MAWEATYEGRFPYGCNALGALQIWERAVTQKRATLGHDKAMKAPRKELYYDKN
jgi:hypothetical protein